jgi:hypothetical protein
MGTKHRSEAKRLSADQRGVLYVEQLVMIGLTLLLATLLGVAGVSLLAPRYQGIAASIYRGVP